jgi:hypothetical protein
MRIKKSRKHYAGSSSLLDIRRTRRTMNGYIFHCDGYMLLILPQICYMLKLMEPHQCHVYHHMQHLRHNVTFQIHT